MIAIWNDIWKDAGHIGLAYVLTASIGWESEREEHSAGVRTFPIFGWASGGSLLLLASPPEHNAQSRLLRGLIREIGFMGGGAILKKTSIKKGTATAASVWNAGVIGAAV